MLQRADRPHPQSDVELELAYFELIDAGARDALLRIGGRWAGIAEDDLEAPTLLVHDGERLHHLQPLEGAAVPAGEEHDAPWHATFAAHELGRQAARGQYSIDAGVVVDLPRPARRRTPGRAPQPLRRNPAHAAAASPPRRGATRPVAASPAAAAPRVPSATERAAAWLRRPVALRWIAAVGVVVIAAGVQFAIMTSGGGSGDERDRVVVAGERRTSPPPTPAPAQPAPAPAPAPITLAPVAAAGTPAAGAGGAVVALPGGRRALELRGLPAGRYGVWLFDTVIDARRIAVVRGPGGRAELPPDARLGEARFLDVSLEDDANPNHSGRSILRVATDRLR